MEIVITIKIEENELVKVNVEQHEAKPVDTYSAYARFYDESCPGWVNDAEYNLTFLKLQETYANYILKTRGSLYLNEVYDLLGIPRSKAGQVVGWVYDTENPSGDNYVDFGLTEERASKFINGYTRSILLDFNVDGNIWERLA